MNIKEFYEENLGWQFCGLLVQLCAVKISQETIDDYNKYCNFVNITIIINMKKTAQPPKIEIDGFIISSDGTILFKCNNIDNCHIPYGVRIIKWNAFKDAERVKQLYIPDSVEEIEDYAFSSLNIEFVHIPSSLKKIGDYVFNDCSNLNTVEMEDGISILGNSMFYGCKSLESITIPESIKVLPDGIFEFCTSLKQVKLPTHLIEIGNCAFLSCSSLESIVLPSSIIGLQDNTFDDCGFSSITIPEGIVAISKEVFAMCKNLTAVKIPATLQHLETDAFEGCYEIYLEVPKGMLSHYEDLDIDEVVEITEYYAEIPTNINELKRKSDSFVRQQNHKRERDDYNYRKEMGELTSKEYFNEMIDLMTYDSIIDEERRDDFYNDF